MVEPGSEAAQQSHVWLYELLKWCICQLLLGIQIVTAKNQCIFSNSDKYEFTDTVQMLTAKPVILSN